MEGLSVLGVRCGGLLKPAFLHSVHKLDKEVAQDQGLLKTCTVHLDSPTPPVHSLLLSPRALRDPAAQSAGLAHPDLHHAAGNMDSAAQ